jgi:type IV pilus assembly protein PilQ
MGNWTRTKAAGLLFVAAAAVYSDGLVRAMASEKATPADGAAGRAPLASAPAEVAVEAREAAAKVAAKVAAKKAPAKAAPPAAAGEAVAEDKDAAVAEADPFAEAPATPVAIEAPVAAKSLTSDNVNVADNGLVEIHVNDANLGEVLRMLSLQLERNIMASKEVRGAVTANLYDVTVKEALDAILQANGFGYREKGNVIYVYTQKELQEIEKAERKMVTETFRVYYTPASNAVTMIKPVLSPESSVSFTTPALSGIEAGGTDLGGNSHATEDTLVVTDYPDRIEQVRKVLKEVDRRPQQILVEAVILRATLKEDNELGVDFSVLGGVDFNNLSGAIGGNTGATGELADKGFGSVQAGGGGLKVGVVTNNVSVFVNALEGVTDTAIVANPKVLVLNKQKGHVHVGARLGYRTAVSTETLTADDVKFLEIGTKLSFRPYIGADGYIRMEINPKDSSGNISADKLPNEFVTEVTSNVMVRDGRTIVIGGLFRESSDTTRSQVPGLGNIPVAGNLFKRTKDSTIREEVIILLTPHIVKDEDAYAAMSEAEQRHIERMRVGVRQGMMPWGRERLAESAYEKAVEELAKPNPDRKKALWHLDCATNLNPKFAEAIELKAQLTGEEVTSVDNSTIKSFVQRVVLADRNRPAAPEATPEAGATGDRKPADAAAKQVDAPAAAATQPAGPGAGDLTASAGDDDDDDDESAAQGPAVAEATSGGDEPSAPATQPAVADATGGESGGEVDGDSFEGSTLTELELEPAAGDQE